MPRREFLKAKLKSAGNTVFTRVFALVRCSLLISILILISFSLQFSEGRWHTVQNNPAANSPHTSLVGHSARHTHPLALVYRGPGGCPGCSEAVAALLQSSKWNFDIKYVGPKEDLKLSAETLKPAVLYAQPGGGGDARYAYKSVVRQLGNPKVLSNWVKAGGRFLGICMGGYLAGTAPGFNLLQGTVGEWIYSPGASWTDDEDTVIQVRWRNTVRWMFFQDGPYFKLNRGVTGATVLATYTNDLIAALTAPYGNGRIGVVGPHPEADTSWYEAHHLTNPDRPGDDLGRDLIDTLMQ